MRGFYYLGPILLVSFAAGVAYLTLSLREHPEDHLDKQMRDLKRDAIIMGYDAAKSGLTIEQALRFAHADK